MNKTDISLYDSLSFDTLCELGIDTVEYIIKRAEKEKLTNDQRLLNFLDELNILSVKY